MDINMKTNEISGKSDFAETGEFAGSGA